MVARAEKMLNDIEDDAVDVGESNADLISLLGYMAGLADTTLSMMPTAAAIGLFEAARSAGRIHALTRRDIVPAPKDNV